MLTLYIFFAIVIAIVIAYRIGKRVGRKQAVRRDEFGNEVRLPGRVENIYAMHSRDEQIRQLRDTVLHQQRMLQQANLAPTSSGLTPDEGRKYMPMQLQLHTANGRRVTVKWMDNGGVRPDIRWMGAGTSRIHDVERWRPARDESGYEELELHDGECHAHGAVNAATFDLPYAGEYEIVVRQFSEFDGRPTQWSNRIRVHVFDTVRLESLKRDLEPLRMPVAPGDRHREIAAVEKRLDEQRERASAYPTADDKREANGMAMECHQPPPYASVLDVEQMDADELDTYIQHLQSLLPTKRTDSTNPAPSYTLGSHSWNGKDDE